MWKGILSVPSAVVLLLFRKELGIASALFLASLCSAVCHVVAHVLGRRLDASRGVVWCPLSVPAFYAAFVLFGGQIVSRDALAWSAYLATTFVLPERREETRTVLLFQENVSVFLASGLFASWLGCAAIPLDWDVEWQVFPVASSILAASASIVVGLFG
jgi:hypothetical protein